MTPPKRQSAASTSAMPSTVVPSLSEDGPQVTCRGSTLGTSPRACGSPPGWSLSAAVVLAILTLAVPAALAQQKTLYVAGYGGSFEQTMRKEIFPAFEAKHGVKVEYIAGNSTDTLAKLQAQKGNQQIDVAIVDDGPMYQAIQLGFCGRSRACPPPISSMPQFKDDKAVAIGLVATGMMYNTKYSRRRAGRRPRPGTISRTPRSRSCW